MDALLNYLEIEKQKKINLVNPIIQKSISESVNANSVGLFVINDFIVSGYITRVDIGLNTSSEYAIRLWADSTKTKLVYASGLASHITGNAVYDDKNVWEFHNQDSNITNKIYCEIINNFTNSQDTTFNITLEVKK